jgi:hypothetical protein
MRLDDPMDPALAAASLALAKRPMDPSSRFASIELRGETRQLSHLAPLGYVASAFLGVVAVIVLWVL